MEHNDNAVLLMQPILSSTKHYRPRLIDEIQHYYCQLLQILERIHKIGITHGDIKTIKYII